MMTSGDFEAGIHEGLGRRPERPIAGSEWRIASANTSLESNDLIAKCKGHELPLHFLEDHAQVIMRPKVGKGLV